LRQLEVEHPAAKVIVELSQMQDKEAGDGTTSVVIIASELLKRANELIKNKVHPATIISGYKRACSEAVKYIEEHLSQKIDSLGKDALVNAAKTSMSSKLIGPESNFFAEMVVDAIQSVKTINSIGDIKYSVKSVHIVKCHGGSSGESKLVKGYVLQTMRVAQQMPSRVENAKIACLDMNLNKFRMPMGVQILVNDPKNLDKIRQTELDILKARCKKIIDAGANVILTTKAVDDVAAKYFVEAGALALRRVDKKDLRRIAKSTGATLLTTLATPEGEELFDASYLGTAKEVYEETVGDNEFVFIKGTKQQNACSIVLRGANEFMLDEIERSIHDSLCVVKRALESGYVVAGGGAVEMGLNVFLEDYARKLATREQIAIAEFAEALTVIPRTLATNAALDATDLVAKLRFFHSKYQTSDDANIKDYIWAGLDLLNGKVRNNLAAGVLEPMINKIKSIKFATEAAITILRIDDRITLQPQKEEMPQRH
jgi:T-complex protein 1 subunit alpha